LSKNPAGYERWVASELAEGVGFEPTVRIFTELGCQTDEIFGKTYRNRGLNPGESAFPDNFFASFRPAAAQLTIRGNAEVFYGNKNFTPNKFD